VIEWWRPIVVRGGNHSPSAKAKEKPTSETIEATSKTFPSKATMKYSTRAVESSTSAASVSAATVCGSLIGRPQQPRHEGSHDDEGPQAKHDGYSSYINPALSNWRRTQLDSSASYLAECRSAVIAWRAGPVRLASGLTTLADRAIETTPASQAEAHVTHCLARLLQRRPAEQRPATLLNVSPIHQRTAMMRKNATRLPVNGNVASNAIFQPTRMSIFRILIPPRGDLQ
jgi:hypothetical protein